MKKVFVSLFLASFAVGLMAQEAPGKVAAKPEEARRIYFPAQGIQSNNVEALVAKATNLTNHGGPVITSAKVVLIFWGPTFANASSADHTYATTLQSFRNQYGTNGEYNTITQYSGSNGTIALSNLAAGTADMFDTATPPTAVSDAAVQGEVNKYLSTHTKDNNTIYEVVIPSTSYSSDGAGDTSCGGPNLQYCAYHSSFPKGSSTVKYTIQPYPSCSGCAVSGWSATQNQEHLVCFETRDVVTDPTGLGWYDIQGREICEKCSLPFNPPPPSFSTVCGPAWSNKARGCF